MASLVLRLRRGFVLVGASALVLAGVVGCGMGGTAGSGGTGINSSGSIKGVLHGGQSPVVGANIYLYATGSTYGGDSTSLLNVTVPGPPPTVQHYVVTDGNGAFNITGDYVCPSATSLVYLLAVGGNPGGGPNDKLAEMAALGNCVTLQASAATTVVGVSEVSTAAAAYALAPFMTSGTAIGAPATNLQGITNAFMTVSNLVDLGTATARSTTGAGNGAVPYQLINTLADFLSLCVNSNGAVTGSTTSPTPCDQVFEATTVGGVVPGDTVAAALSMAKNPGNNPGTIWAAQPASPPYLPTLTASPNDLTMAILYTGGGLQTPVALAIDSAGDVWVADDSVGSQSATGSALTEIEAGSGVFRFGGSGGTTFNLLNPQAMAFTKNGNLWISNYGTYPATVPSYVTLIADAQGATPVATEPAGATFGFADQITVDSTDRAWVLDVNDGSLAVFGDTGTFVFQTVPGTNYPTSYTATSISADGVGKVWVTEPTVPGTISQPPETPAPFALDATGQVVGVAGGTAGENVSVWISPLDESIWDVSAVENSYAISSGTSPYAGTGYYSANTDTSPYPIAFDGAGVAWSLNGGSRLAGITETGDEKAGPNGFRAGYLGGSGGAEGFDLATDGSGNLWVSVASYNASVEEYAGVLQVIGLTTPVTTPIVSSMGHALP
jgi:hypothetical protein